MGDNKTMFRNRGELPNINTNAGGNIRKGGYSAPHYTHYWRQRYIIVRYDKTFLAIELIATLIILLTIAAVYLFAYQVSFKDPIATIKSNFLTAQIISIGISLIATGLVTFFTKSSKENLIKYLRIIATISTLIIIIFLGIKLYMDNKYNEDTFGNFYEQYEQAKDNKNSTKINIELSGIKVLDPKGAYIDKSVNAYTNFSVKTILYMIIHILRKMEILRPIIIAVFLLSYIKIIYVNYS